MKMEAFRISVEVSVNLSEKTQDFIKSLLSGTIAPALSSDMPEKPKATTTAKPKTAAPVVEVAPKVEATPVEEQKAITPKVEAAPKSKPKSIEDVRMMLAKKVNEHRDVIKQKLNDLGAPSVTKLDPAKYDEMFNFLESL